MTGPAEWRRRFKLVAKYLSWRGKHQITEVDKKLFFSEEKNQKTFVLAPTDRYRP
jgi:hypothetical protein